MAEVYTATIGGQETWTPDILPPGTKGGMGVALCGVDDVDQSPLNSTGEITVIWVRAWCTGPSNSDGNIVSDMCVGGNGTASYLIIGGSNLLAASGVTGLLSNPQIQFFHGETLLATNAGWNNPIKPTPAASAAKVTVRNATPRDFVLSGSPILTTGSWDSAMVVTVPADACYATILSGATGGAGNATIQIYKLFYQ
jgi:hypothetical protein